MQTQYDRPGENFFADVSRRESIIDGPGSPSWRSGPREVKVAPRITEEEADRAAAVQFLSSPFVKGIVGAAIEELSEDPAATQPLEFYKGLMDSKPRSRSVVDTPLDTTDNKEK